MPRFKKQNLRHIKNRFEEKTGVDLNPAHRMQLRRPVRTTLILAAVLLFAMTMLAFSGRLFTPLDGDKLSLSAVYEGDGIVSITVENGSDKTLEFQEQTKLIRWVTGEEVESIGGKVTFENTQFPPHSCGTMIVDLSDAYDVEALEKAKTNIESYYLLLTNQDFLFGHDWICSFRFAQPKAEPQPEETQPVAPVQAEGVDAVEEELRFYFEEAYGGMPISFNEANFLYQQKVEELLLRFDGDVVTSLSPSIMVAGPSEHLDPEPMLRDIPDGVIFDDTIAADKQHLLTSWEWTHTDAYGRMVATVNEKAMVQVAFLPQHQGVTDGGVTIPLVFLLVYDAERASDPDNYAFIYGQLHTFAELEQYKVLQDEHYAIYDATDLIYTDVDAYLDYYLTTRTDVYCDDKIRERVRNIYEFYQDGESLADLFYYREAQ